MKIYHVSEEAGIEIFHPRPSPSFYEKISGDVVFAVSESKLHNYLLPRDCPRVAYYAADNTAKSDIERFIRNEEIKHIIAIDEKWLERIKAATLYLYELPVENFVLLDKTAGYYISYNAVSPVSVSVVADPLAALKERNVNIRISSDLRKLAEEVSASTLQFSIIRLRNL